MFLKNIINYFVKKKNEIKKKVKIIFGERIYYK